MEAKAASSGGEVRRLHIIYFLSRRMGRVDHPHLIRVNHFTRNGVYLRDVKRWLADLRGKEMPEGFAWSYKRRYKTGYVWQDLLDEDLITPISDNEYVLKGSEITSSPFDSPPKSFAEKRSCLFKDEVEPPNSKQEASFQLHQQIYPKNNIDIQTKVSSEMSQESQRSTLTDGFDDANAIKLKPKGERQEHNHSAAGRDKLESSFFYSNFLLKRKKKIINKDEDAKELASSTTPSSFSSSASSSSSSSYSPSQQTPLANGSTKRHSSASSNMFRNLITCGAVDTNDAVVVMLNRANKTSNKSTSRQDSIKADHRISKGDHKSEGRSTGVFGTCRNPQELPQQPRTATRKSYDGQKDATKQQNEGEFSGQKAASAAYRPVGRPHCSQCRKLFKPERLHSHMKSCRGVKAETKILEMGSRTSNSEESASAFLT
ncbi:protein SOSEKI 1-like [Malus sylvestris]|uniref:protein SOSEKI 1-like n=1 Tax=Malus sylvestris TaxID=3752 RepID=UPI0021AB9FB8|nr:protein SOSEKI 1-like [Malus sylvestris]XP_050156999.1 protein SOSEKI 1-like [Malus sylvestris]XP_050157000.1 protein SOSEKI 1-like [Malus sylvestris]XP_050157001.1 protein SOSEKI 1-like [Malus sylvestris]XP_050157002.1 protein SOSEKI 1-like [Malus sylvestris]